jgi:hypothetical protein
MSETTIRASDFCGPEEGAVDSGKRLARRILDALEDHARVLVAMDSVSGAGSSFSNVIFTDLAAKLGPAVARSRVEFTGMGRTQAVVASRSRDAVLRV